MTEHFSKIEDETFPSFLGESVNSSETLENCTLSSNLGLPVAASTIAKARKDFDRCLDTQASYLENCAILPSASIHRQSGENSKGKYVQSFNNEDMDFFTGLSNANTPTITPGSSENVPKERTVHSQDTSIGFPAGNEKGDFPAFASDACSLSVEHQHAKINDVPNLYKDMRRQSQDLLNDDFSISVASFLANEKLLSIASLDDSSSDDLDDEEFYDGQLEAYFNRLLPGMQRGVIEGQETSEPNRGYQMVGQHGRPSFRPCLEGGNSEDESSNGVQTVPNGSGSLICLQSDGQERCSPRTSPAPGDWSSVKEDSGKGEIANITQPQTKATVSLGSDGRYVAGEEITTKMLQNLSLKQEDIKNCELCDLSSGQKLDRLYFEKGDMTLLQSVAEKESPVFSSVGKEGCDKKSESIHRINETLADGKEVNCLSDAYLSPTFERSRNDTSPPWQSTQAQPFLWSFGPSNDGEGGSAPHSVVYQNEEGKWVTDLAYYKSFDNESPSFSGEVLNEEHFVEGGNALAMIEEDQEEFEREHKFIQEEKMDLENVSLNMGDTSWKLPTSGNVLLRASQVAPDLLQEDASYLRLSLGEFFGQRSEALGCLGGGDGVKRPSFGYHIISPDKQEPFALLRTSDLSGNSEQDETIKSFEDTLTQEQYESLPDEQKLASTTFDVKMQQNRTALDKTVKDPQMDKSNIEVKDCVSEEVKPQSSESMLLSISTIAAAIANASTNADPSQLAAMIMALSNKNRNSNLLELGNQTPRNQSVFSSLEKENCEGAIDMERYLKATEVTCQEGETNVFLDSLKDFTWDMSLRLKHTLKSSVADLSNTVATEKQNLKTIDNSGEFKENFAIQNVSGICRPEQVSNESSEGTLSYRNAPSKLRTVVLNSTDILGSNQMEYRTNKVSKIPGSNSFAAEEQDIKDSPLLTAASNQLTRTSDGIEKLEIKASNECCGGSDKLENAENFSSNFTGCVKTLRSPRKSSSCVSATVKEPKHCEEASQKHVSFQPPSYKQMSQDTDNAVHGLEEEQYSFRPSTSPLIHSSPSQDSLKLSDHGGEEFLYTATAAQNPVCVSSSRESSCYSPSMSRLTYVSTMENSFENVSIKSLENKSNNTIELSTTIVRSSPTPEMQLIKPANMSWQQNVNQKSGYSPNQKSNDPSGYSTAASIIINNKSEELLSLNKNNLELKDHSLKYKEKMKEVSSGISNDAYNYFITPHFQVDTPYTWQEFPTKSREGLPSLNMQSASRLVNYPLMQNISVNHQFVPEPDFKPVVSASDLQKLPSSVPTLFTGQPLSTTQFAHQYLGNVHSLGCSTIPSHQVGNTVLCTGYPGSTAQAQHIQNTITGLTGTSNVGSGLLATLPRSQNLPPGSQNIVISASGYPGQFISATGLQHFDTRISSDYGQVLVPEELTFPSACCVGIASQASLNIFNPTDRWLQVNIGVLSVAINGEKVDPTAYQCLVFKNKTIIGPRTAEDLKILFLPQRAGLFQCVLNVSSWPVSADSQTVVRSEALAAKVLLTAVSENPSIEIETGKTGCLDFGDLSSGSWKTLPLKILNKTHATLPIRLIISANATAWRCFTFSKDATNHSLHMDVMSKMSSPSVLSHVLHASCDGQDSEFLVVWVIFHAPQTYTSTDTLGPAEEFIARVDVEVDSPGPACILKSVPLHARVGCARIHAPKDLQTIHLLCKVGSSSKQILPLKNAGNISVHLKIMASSSSERDFTVNPEELFLVPGEEHVVSVQYTPQHVEPKKSVLKIMVEPSGPQYEVMLVGETEIPTSKNPITATADVPPILSNKQFVAWGGVALGRTVQQKLILRNTSTTSSQYLRLLIKGQDQDCFQLQSTFGHEERLIKNREVTIRPKEDASIHLMFSPTRVSCMLAKLEIKQSGIKSSQPGIKFTIPLSGYGGTSNIILEDVKKLADSYTVTVNELSSGIASKVSFLIRNTGSRAAYVKAVCFADIYNNVKNDSNMLSVSPEKFVLKERSQEMITLFCKPRKREIALQNSSSLICTVCFFCGDEIARQQFRRALLHKPESANRIIAENAILKNTRFDEEFSGEQTVSEVYDLPQRPNDIQLFLGNMQKIVLSVTGNDSNANIEEYKSSRQTNSAVENTECNVENTSLDVLPVKGPQGPHLSASEPAWDCVNSQQAWSVQPEHLVLAAPSISGVAETGHVKIINISTKVLQFELSWPAHCLTITPQHGRIEPKSHIIILVSPNPSLATRQTLLPWKGPIYVHCENVHKCIQVQIREDVNPDKSTNDSVPKSVAVVPPHPETSIHKGKSICKSPSKVDIKNRTLIFPKTTSGGSSETFLEIENPGDEEVKWLISSFAPPYVKGVDESGDVYRATYTAFRCSRVSGMLAAHEKLKVAISFFPREKGDYSQFWDLECHPFSESHLKYKLRFQLCGEGIKDETVSGKSSAEIFIKTEAHVKPRQRSGSEASSLKTVQQETTRGVYASEDLYTFPPTFVGDSSTLKVNLQNNSFTTYMLKFVSPKAPFQMKHSKYSLRAHHYINLPVKFKPSSAGRFEDHLVVQTDAGNIPIQFVGEALVK